MSQVDLLTQKLPFIRALPVNAPLQKDRLCVPELLLDELKIQGRTKETVVKIFYAPFDYINTTARIVIIGITPGWSQMQIAFQQMRDALAKGASVDDAQMQAKVKASFAGTMRSNLTRRLNSIGVAEALTIASTDDLFHGSQRLAQMTSALRYPVFVDNKNYDGYKPPVSSKPVRTLFEKYWRDKLVNELGSTQGEPLIVPLGSAVAEVVEILVEDHKISKEQCLFDFPHPSNGPGLSDREQRFNERKDELKSVVHEWSKTAQ